MASKDYFGDSHSAYRKLLKDTASHDITFIVDNQRIGATKVILAANSDYFNTLLNDGAFIESSQAEITLEDVSAETFKFLIEFCYLGRLELSRLNQNVLKDLILAANRFQVSRLFEAVKAFVFDGITPDNCFMWHGVADTLQNTQMIETIKSKVKSWHQNSSNYERTQRSREFMRHVNGSNGANGAGGTRGPSQSINGLSLSEDWGWDDWDRLSDNLPNRNAHWHPDEDDLWP